MSFCGQTNSTEPSAATTATSWRFWGTAVAVGVLVGLRVAVGGLGSVSVACARGVLSGGTNVGVAEGITTTPAITVGVGGTGVATVVWVGVTALLTGAASV